MGISQARILEWVATSSSRGFSRPKDGIQVSPIAGRFFTIRAPGKPYGNKSTPKKVNHGQVGGNIIRCFTNFQFPMFFLKNLRLTGKKRGEGVQKTICLVGMREHERFQEVKTESRRLAEGLETTRKEAETVRPRGLSWLLRISHLKSTFFVCST